MTAETCDTCGLPDELCVCTDMAKTESTFSVEMEKRSFDKPVTLITGVQSSDVDGEELASELKSSFGCGGTYKKGNVELQGDHRDRARDELESRGYVVE